MATSARPHRPLPERTEQRALYMASRTRETATGCIEYQGPRNPAGYGYVSFSGVVYLAHRVALAWETGITHTELTCDHLCRNPSCVNPEHLEWVTQQENNHRSNGWSGRHSRVTECPHGHPYDDENTRIRASGRRACRTCERIRDRARYARRKASA